MGLRGTGATCAPARGALTAARPSRAGFFLDLPRASNATNYWYRANFQGADSVWNSTSAGTLNTACLAANTAALWRCYLAEYTTQYIATPLYISNSPIDMWGLGNVLDLGCIPTMTNSTVPAIPGKPCGPSQWGQLQGWFGAFHDRLLPLLARNAAMGAFIPSCFVHEM